MSYATTNRFTDFLDEHNVKWSYASEDENTIRIGYNLDNTHIAIFVIFGENCTDAGVRGVDFINVPKDKIAELIFAINKANCEYRWITFTIDSEDGSVVARADAVINEETCADVVFELVVRMNNVVDEVYPELMKAMWA